MIPECYGADIFRAALLNTLEDCISGCKSREDCKFISYGGFQKGCILKSGLTSVLSCTGCDSNGHCANEGSCDIGTDICSVNVYHNEGKLLNTTLILCQ